MLNFIYLNYNNNSNWRKHVAQLLVFGLNVNIIEDVVESIDLCSCSMGIMLFQHIIRVVTDVLLLSHGRVWTCRMLTTLLHSSDWDRWKILGAQIWLKLLQKHENQRNLILLVQILNGGVLDFLQIEMHVFITFQDIRCLIENVIKEFSHEQGCSLVLLSRNIHFLLELYIVAL